jgi:hypothetical protein
MFKRDLFHFFQKKLLFIAAALLSVNSARAVQVEGLHEFSNRKEGTSIQRDAAIAFSIVGIHRNFEPFPRNSQLMVRFFLPTLAQQVKKTVFIQASELRESTHYLMQSKDPSEWKKSDWKDNDWNLFGSWETNAVIDVLKLPNGENALDASNIGVIGAYHRPHEPLVYLPVDVYRTGDQLTKKTYTLWFVTGKKLDSLEVSVADAKGVDKNKTTTLKCNKAIVPGCWLYDADTTQSIEVDLSSLPEGEYHLTLKGTVPGTKNRIVLPVWIYHHS